MTGEVNSMSAEAHWDAPYAQSDRIRRRTDRVPS